MTQDWIERHTPSPETLAKIKTQRTREIQGEDTKGDMAIRYLGLCPECAGMVNFGHVYTRRNGMVCHYDCDPDKPEPQCWCGGELRATETEHLDCFVRRQCATTFTHALAGIFSPLPVAKFPRYRA